MPAHFFVLARMRLPRDNPCKKKQESITGTAHLTESFNSLNRFRISVSFFA